MRELDKLLKGLDSAIAEIIEIDLKVKEKVKAVILTGDKIDKVFAKALMTKILDTPEKTIERLLNIQKMVFEGIQLKHLPSLCHFFFKKQVFFLKKIKSFCPLCAICLNR
ncbi:hypothetical protein DSO57_1011488 [Entomophthora muscae]|uniref:Uncharacterized protein n=1 Tax=Entomophthora muscae TaxID=34485 RepID=A0ACC2RXH2_9FUNG|nr:hypothetical protein DSO57_1011488 [Entomophthora muscae]